MPKKTLEQLHNLRVERYEKKVRTARAAFHAARVREREEFLDSLAVHAAASDEFDDQSAAWREADTSFAEAVTALEQGLDALGKAEELRRRQKADALRDLAEKQKQEEGRGVVWHVVAAGRDRRFNPFEEELFMPALREAPPLDMRRLPLRQFDEAIDAGVPAVKLLLRPVLEHLEKTCGESAGFETFVSIGGVAAELVGSFYAEATEAQLQYALANAVAGGKSYLTFTDLEALFAQIFSPEARHDVVYTCFLRLFSEPTLQKLRNRAGGFGKAEAGSGHRQRRKTDFDGPELVLKKEFAKALSGAGLPHAEGERRARMLTQFRALTEEALAEDGGAVEGEEGEVLPAAVRESPVMLTAAKFAKLLLSDAGVFALFIGTMMDVHFEQTLLLGP